MTTHGSGENQFQPFATGVGANVESPGNWAEDPVVQQGFQRGILPSQKLNTPIRQATFISAMLAQFMADYTGTAVEDDGDLISAEDKLVEALRALLAPMGVYFMTDTGAANAMVGTSSPAPESYASPGLIVIRKMNASNTGAMTVNFWDLGVVSLTDMTGAPLTNGALLAGGLYILAYSGGGYRVLGGTATYQNITNLTANSGDMIEVTGSGVVNWRTSRGTHDTTVDANDKWPRGDAGNDAAKYMLTNEFVAWVESSLGSPLRNVQVFLSSGTYTPTPGAKKALVILTGGGGAGGGGSGWFYSAGSGGGSGATVFHLLNLSGVVTVPVVIGAKGTGTFATSSTRAWFLWPWSVIYGDGGDGGTSTFGSYCSASGGKGGRGGYLQSGLGGNGGDKDASTGNLMINGGSAGENVRGWSFWSQPHSGNGGASFWGGAGLGATHCWWWYSWWLGTNGQNGQDGQAPGAGGGGGGGIEVSRLTGITHGKGGDGMAGACMILEF